MAEAAEELAAGREAASLLSAGKERLLAGGFAAVDYLELRDAETLAPLERVGQRPGRLLAAARLGSTRLIDNIAVPVLA
jgi:pantoate--beta-alanine ligase